MQVANEVDVFGEYYIDTPITPTEATLTTAGAFYTLGGVNVQQNLNIDINGTTGELTALYDGNYFIAGVASIYPSAGTIITFALFKNGVIQNNIRTQLEFQNNQDTNNFAGTGFVKLLTGDILTVRASSTTAGLTLYIRDLNIHIHRIGL